MSRWYSAVELPKEFEGELAWRWNPTLGNRVEQVRVPVDYSRIPRHCANVHFYPITVPAPPDDWTDWRVAEEAESQSGIGKN